MPVFLATGTNVDKKNYEETSPCTIKERFQAGCIVRKGDVICSYTEKELKKTEQSQSTDDTYYSPVLFRAIRTATSSIVEIPKEIKAPCDGIVFFADEKKKGQVSDKMDEYVEVYVVSYFDDYNDFTAWLKSGNK